MNRTLLDERFRIARRQTWYVGIDEIQRNLDRFMNYYSLERSYQGYRLNGRTPTQALRKGSGYRGTATADQPGGCYAK